MMSDLQNLEDGLSLLSYLYRLRDEGKNLQALIEELEEKLGVKSNQDLSSGGQEQKQPSKHEN